MGSTGDTHYCSLPPPPEAALPPPGYHPPSSQAQPQIKSDAVIASFSVTPRGSVRPDETIHLKVQLAGNLGLGQLSIETDQGLNFDLSDNGGALALHNNTWEFGTSSEQLCFGSPKSITVTARLTNPGQPSMTSAPITLRILPKKTAKQHSRTGYAVVAQGAMMGVRR